ncbi:MAG: substrate-binding domain-containing protein [Eubacteriales bacterium]|nr:substrate-binding domain-containing protein [Eubacteriales bacterium]
MKRILAICLATIMGLSLMGCGGGSKTQENTETAAEETSGLDKSCVGRFADSTAFDPDTETDSMDGGDLAGKGDLDSMDIDWSTVKAAIIVKTLSNESWTNIAGGMKDALEAHGVKTVDLVAPDSESDAEQQQSLCDALVNKGYDIIFMSPQGDTTLDAQCRDAHDAGTVVVNAFDSTMQGADLYVGNISLDTGRLAAKYICEDWSGEEGQVAVIEGLPGAYASINRTAGFLEGCENYDGIEVVADVVGNWDRQEAMDQAATIINQYPDIKGIYCCNDTMALGVIEAVKEAGKLGQICVVGSDGVEGAISSIGSGEQTGTIDLNLYEGGKMAAEAGLYLLAGVDMPRVIKVPQIVITEDNTADHVGYDPDK